MKIENKRLFILHSDLLQESLSGKKATTKKILWQIEFNGT